MALEIGKTYKNEYGSDVEIIALKHGDYIGYIKESNTAGVYDRHGKSLQLTSSDLILKQEIWVEIYKVDAMNLAALVHKSELSANTSVADDTVKVIKVEL